MVDNELLPKLSQNLLEILNDEEFYDITIEVGNDPYVKIFRAHMVILYYRSPYLRRILSTDKKKMMEHLPFADVNNYSKEDFNTLKNTLQQYLLKEFLDNDNKKSDKSKPHILKEIDSKIITYQHIELISKWINRLEITDKLISPYAFKLLFHGSRDGLYPKKFYEFCDNKSRTVTVIKVEDNDEILGGYNPIK
ncbi:hypothetical protein C1645_879522 [Glomus cerebriforme]|uniref:BTB domain-containing protein n=1 Tax=Glomus cerebriforme TaxID=658196 RepID=A0A397SKD5_9GLOM|nr:hypothetical protein C1645_879522 [Glomus cerebriforme]